MSDSEWLASRFEQDRGRLQSIAYRLLGSVNEAEDAVQETWLRLNRSDASTIENLSGWLTTVLSRVCLDTLRSRRAKREGSLEEFEAPVRADAWRPDPENEVLMADSVGLALLVILDRLSPAERIAFVLHDVFGLSFDEIAQIVGRSPASARQLASRARRQVRGADIATTVEVRQQRDIVSSFHDALRRGSIDDLLAVLDPDLTVHIDPSGARPGAPAEIRGAANWAKGAVAFSHLVGMARLALVDGRPGLVLASGGKLGRIIKFTFASGKIADIEIIADPARLRQVNLAVLES